MKTDYIGGKQATKWLIITVFTTIVGTLLFYFVSTLPYRHLDPQGLVVILIFVPIIICELYKCNEEIDRWLRNVPDTKR